jgi:hypothetical protein
LKKIFAIVLLTSFLVQITGYHLYFNILQQNIKSTVKKTIHFNLSEKVTEHFVFSLANTNASEMPEWEGENEFSLNGEMYDVVSMKKENSMLYVSCISDKKENELINSYKNIAGKDFGGPSKNRAALILKLAYSLFTNASNIENHVKPQSIKVQWLNYTSFLYNSTIDVLTPPPQIA